MKKKIALSLATLLSVSSLAMTLAGCNNNGKMDISDVSVPTYAKTEGVVFAAYSGPTVANWSGSSKNVSTITREHFQKFVDAGFSRLLAIHEGAPSGGNASDPFEMIRLRNQRAEEDALTVLEIAEEFDVEYYVRDWPFYDLWNHRADGIQTYDDYERVISTMINENSSYLDSPSFYGHFGRDEPGADQFEALAWQIELYQKYMEEKGVEGEFMLNLLPNYASDAAYGGETGDPISYKEYVNRYFEQLAPLLGYVSYDYYPFKGDSKTGSMMRTSYVQNLEIMAQKCKEGGYELRTFVQTGGDFTGLRDLTSIADFRLQVYTNLAFGSKMMTYYEYGTFKSQNEGEFGLINLQDGTYNYTYDLAKKVNNEVHAFEDAYLNFNYDRIMCFSALPAGQINVNFRGVANKLTQHDRIANVSVSEDAIMGTFKDARGNDAFMLVNYTDPYFNLNNRVTVQFNNARALLMYRFGEKHVVPLNKDGTYTFELYPGEGRFIIPLA